MDTAYEQCFPGLQFGLEPVGADSSAFRNDGFLKLQILRHPKFPAVVDLVFDIQRQGALPAKQEEMSARHRRTMTEIRSYITQNQVTGSPVKDPKLDDFMTKYSAVLENYKHDITSTEHEVDELIKGFDAEIADILKTSGTAQPTDNTATAGNEKVGMLIHMTEEQQHTELKRRYGKKVMELQTQFCVKRVRKVLPTAATNSLKKWWKSHFAWPYPTDAEKSLLSEETGLDINQVNNWLINQRKRGWHKYFPGGVPKSAEESVEMLKMRGIRPRG